MSDNETSQQEQDQKGDKTERTVPYDRFQQVNEKAKTLSAQIDELKAWKDEQEAKNLSDLERVTKAREEAEQRAQQAEQRAVSLERGGWVTSAAAAASFDDPSDALAFVDLNEIESERDAKRAVKELAERKPKLLRDKDAVPPMVGRVLQEGRAVDATKQNGDVDPKEALGAGIFDFLSGRQ